MLEVGKENEGFRAEAKGAEDGRVVGRWVEEGDVEDDVGEVRVLVVVVGKPVVGVEVDLDVAADCFAVDEELGVFEVGAFESVPEAGLEDLDSFSGEGEEVVGDEVLVEPDFLEDEFGDRDGSVGAVDELFVGAGSGGA